MAERQNTACLLEQLEEELRGEEEEAEGPPPLSESEEPTGGGEEEVEESRKEMEAKLLDEADSTLQQVGHSSS